MNDVFLENTYRHKISYINTNQTLLLLKNCLESVVESEFRVIITWHLFLRCIITKHVSSIWVRKKAKRKRKEKKKLEKKKNSCRIINKNININNKRRNWGVAFVQCCSGFTKFSSQPIKPQNCFLPSKFFVCIYLII